MSYIDAQIDVQIQQRTGYDYASEAMKAYDLRKQLEATIEEPMT